MPSAVARELHECDAEWVVRLWRTGGLSHTKRSRRLVPGRRRDIGRRRLQRRRTAEATALADGDRHVDPDEARAVQPPADAHRAGATDHADTDAESHGPPQDADPYAARTLALADGPGGAGDVHAGE